MATPEFKFTKAAIEKLPIPPPERKRDMHRDTESKYLRLIVTPAGSRVFYFVRKWEGETKFWKIGAFPEVSIHEARAAAEEYSANLRRGEPTKKERTASMTLGALFEQFVEEYAKERKKTWRDDIQRFNAHLSHWQNRKAAKITRRDVKRLHRELKQDQGRDDRGVKRGGPYSANRTLALLRKLYNWAQEEEVIILPEGNPAANVKPHPEQERETRLEGDTLAAFWAA
ncbi:MAG: Arm DNA-binding domain-containing protein, partial [Thiohalospira sp.]